MNYCELILESIMKFHLNHSEIGKFDVGKCINERKYICSGIWRYNCYLNMIRSVCYVKENGENVMEERFFVK